jgi:glutamate-1-semialdehyde 2,1-aminomutase
MKKFQQKLFRKAQKYLVGGVNSPLRAFKPVGGNPLFISKGQGSRVKDADGREYIDYVGAYGPLILGHAYPKVISAIKKAIAGGSVFGAGTEAEIELAKEICAAFPSLKLLRLTNSGTEAVAGALKLARAFTKRNQIIKFKECYHGWSEQPYLEASYNDLDSVEKLVSNDIAAIIVEPVAGNYGVLAPARGFLEGLRQICDREGILLIFDEVITGFRVARGGAQQLFGVSADLTCLGKIIGGGMPVGAFGGKAEMMRLLAPQGPVYQAGTFSGNPVTVAAGLATLKILKNPKVYRALEEKAKKLTDGLGLPVTRVGSMFSFNLGNNRCLDEKEFRNFFWKMLKGGVYFAPSAKEANFISTAHSSGDIAKTIAASHV